LNTPQRVSICSFHDLQQPNRFEHRKLLRKIDWRIVPLAAWACGLQFVDKVYTNLSFYVMDSYTILQSGLGAAATYGLRDDLHLVGQEYSWCVSVRLPEFLLRKYKPTNCGGGRYSILDTLQGLSSLVAACNISMLECLWG
jgi:hypothetical protein